ncbi:uncharacterized protein LAESUDRAFT_131614 [Laetiporus sulphureus 93-53]|uniref:Peptidase C14 caspase domain-containing protein n=1 Tax=Laetiporus sulphureus 93-53 TaxID=1314785 RepID=A0A165EHS8_9APHY|nr:uncharacterized protein LAESUDRAFT_131614 [Laetiporus sulphureus 93-53]KZT07075.1 hypothetical protein LAESUDRAFT_131614 [Laetiporus sulphureus 93-53]
MKIIRYLRRQQSDQPPKKKALIVGIKYDTPESPKSPDYVQLVGPHKDAQDFRDLLIDTYGYAKEDVTVMTDGKGDISLAPTKANMVREMRRLVKDARPGDHFVFLYSGHSDQIPCLEGSEDDGMDEVILPMDHECLEKREKLIIDNDLRKLLVDSLPVGAYLTAIFDTCHSGTMLDLEHYRCNAIYHPWVSKGWRRFKTLWMWTVLPSKTFSLRSAPSRLHNMPSLAQAFSRSSQHRHPAPEKTFPFVRQRSPLTRVQSPPTSSQSPTLPVELHRGRLARRRGSFIIKSTALQLKTTALGLIIPQCMSPVSQLRECDGDCVASPTEKAHVISISACGDSQVDWEGGNIGSMTQALVKYLRQHPHPTLHELMEYIDEDRHQASMRIHKIGNNIRKKGKRVERSQGTVFTVPIGGESVELPVEVLNFQDPQLGSLEKLVSSWE